MPEKRLFRVGPEDGMLAPFYAQAESAEGALKAAKDEAHCYGEMRITDVVDVQRRLEEKIRGFFTEATTSLTGGERVNAQLRVEFFKALAAMVKDRAVMAFVDDRQLESPWMRAAGGADTCAFWVERAEKLA